MAGRAPVTFSLPRISSPSWAFAALALLLFSAPVGLTAHAQDEKAAPAPEPDAAPPPAPDPAPEPEAEAAGTTAPTPAAPASSSGIVWFIKSSGIFGFIIIIMSVTMVALVIRMFLEYRLSEAIPPTLVDKLDTAIKDRKFQEAYDLCRDDPSFLARLIRTGVANLPYGRTEAKEAMNATAEEIVVGMEGRNNYLATIATLGPMLGLVGTVQGMIRAFYTLATVQGVQVDPTRLAGDISLGLVTTLEGLIVAVPAVFFFSFFRARITFLAVESIKIAERTINAFWHAAKQQPGTAPVSSAKPNP
jgi:biopolymer transport protein ExbB